MNKVLGIFTILMLSFATLFAQDDQTKKEEKGEENPAVRAALLAYQMTSYGVANNQPTLLVSAAEMLMEHPFSELKIKDEEKAALEGAEGKKAEDKDSDEIELDPKALLAKAKSMAEGNNELLAMIAKLESKPAKKGALGGAVYTRRRVNAYSTYSFNVTFVGNRYAEIIISGDGDTDLDFYVYDSNGNLVGSDTDYTDDAYFYWTPRRTETYRFVVKNRGNVYNNFVIATN
ncbi:MAG: hypothetical protein JJT94_10355 [Bernardetiaceae bacterium]|nr:hypothetical protein [Bernardetiaceae bacterium]